LSFLEEEDTCKKKKIKRGLRKYTKSLSKIIIRLIKITNLSVKTLLKIVLITCFSLFVASCSTFRHGNEEWPLPTKPTYRDVRFVPVEKYTEVQEDGFYINGNNATCLAENIDDMKVYIEKLEILIRRMKKYYDE
jgi:hypothetical protein